MTGMIRPELGQLFTGYFNGYATPGYVTTGIETIDLGISTHIYGVRPAAHDYGVYADDATRAVINSGWVHDLRGAPFELRAYCWCDGGTHADGCPPNFRHAASGFEAYWYKHSGRGESCNQEVSLFEWQKIQRDCEDWIAAQPPAFRLLVTGSREWGSGMYEPVPGKKWTRLKDGWQDSGDPDLAMMLAALKTVRTRAAGRHIRLVHGSARGADQIAALLTSRATNASAEAHPALWGRKQDGTHNAGAGFQRNERMVESGVDLCVAFFKRGATNRGTTHCSDVAREAGVEVIEVWSD